MSGVGGSPGYGRSRQSLIYRAGLAGHRPQVPVRPEELERKAKRAMSRTAWAYVAGGAGTEATVRANREAFLRRRIVPRVLRDVSVRDTSVELFGRRLPVPVLLGPVGAVDLVRRGSDVAVARAGAAEGVPVVFSHQTARPVETLAAAMGDAPRWFQLYWSTENELVESFVGRAEAAGCEALVVTLDTTMVGWRPRDLDRANLPFARGLGIATYTSDPVFRRLVDERVRAGGPVPTPRPTPALLRSLADVSRNHPGSFWENLRSPVPRAAVQTFLDVFSRPSLNWSDLDFLRGRTTLPVVLKGVLHPDDARRAVDAGAAAIVVSNHGGRQVDGGVGTLDALPAVVEAVGGRIPVLLDSGVRSGADVVKALALGATAVLLGRQYVHGLAVAGERGVREVIRNLRAEFDLTLGLAGVRAASELGPDVLQE